MSAHLTLAGSLGWGEGLSTQRSQSHPQFLLPLSPQGTPTRPAADPKETERGGPESRDQSMHFLQAAEIAFPASSECLDPREKMAVQLGERLRMG